MPLPINSHEHEEVLQPYMYYWDESFETRRRRGEESKGREHRDEQTKVCTEQIGLNWTVHNDDRLR